MLNLNLNSSYKFDTTTRNGESVFECATYKTTSSIIIFYCALQERKEKYLLYVANS